MRNHKKTKPKVLWFQAITCNGNTHSFLSANSNRMKLFLNSFDLIYHPSLTANTSLSDILSSNTKIDYVLVEGAITSNERFFSISNSSTYNILNKLIKRAKYLISVGSCASYGGMHSKFEQNDDIKGVKNALASESLYLLKHPIINLTGCPVHP